MFEWSQFWGWFYLAFLLSATPVTVMIILEKRSPFKTAAWILLLILLPIFGVIFYLIFGQEYRKRKMFSRKGLKGLIEVRKLATKQLKEIGYLQSDSSTQLHEHVNTIGLLLNNAQAPITTKNDVDLLINGSNTFAAIFKAIEDAQHHIHLEYYILSDDEIGQKLQTLLIQKRNQGIEVRIIFDDVGSWSLKKSFIEKFGKNGIEIFPFMEVRFPRLTSRVNYRNHRKILIIDGKIAFVGGINITDRYINGTNKLGAWHDMHLQIRGDAAAYLQLIFIADWFFVSQQNLQGINYFPPFSKPNNTPIQIVASGPDYEWESMAQAFFSAIGKARQKVYFATPYLMPPPALLFALQTAALSNIDVRIIIPKKSDSRLSKWASFSYVEKLLEAGVRIYFFQKGFIHSKYMLVDDVFSTVGTTNFDFRSFETNFEANAFIYCKNFNRTLNKQFDVDMKNSKEVTLHQWQKRAWQNKLRESLAHIVSPMF